MASSSPGTTVNLYDATNDISFLENTFSTLEGHVLVPENVGQAIATVASYFRASLVLSAPQLTENSDSNPVSTPTDSRSAEPTVQLNVKLNRQTTVCKLYTYLNPDHILEFPETSSEEGGIGHLFRVDPRQWVSPARNFVYSLGGERGSTIKNSKSGKHLFNALLKDEHGTNVPCRVSSKTCELHLYCILDNF